MEWEDLFRDFLKALNKIKPVILCGDLNVAHEEIDIKNPKTNRNNAGFTDKERSKMTELLGAGFIDAFRLLYPEKTDAYTWWSYFASARDRNIGWRIDYFVVSEALANNIKECIIHDFIMGSDHCPVELIIDLEEK
jgi:exodeoxyribonuclease-3